MSDGCLSVPDKRWHCSLDNRTGPRNSPGPGRHPGTMTRNFPYGRDIFPPVAIARTGPPVWLSRPGDCRAQKSRRVAINCETLSRHRGISTAHKSPVSDGIKNKLKSRTHLLSVSLKLAANVRKAANTPVTTKVWLCHIFLGDQKPRSHVGWELRKMSGKNYSEDLWRDGRIWSAWACPAAESSNALNGLRINNDAKRVTSMEFIHWIPWNNLNFPRQEGIPCL